MSDVDFKYFPLVVGEIVDCVRSEYDPINDVLPKYQYGTYLELLEYCKISDRNQNLKYPLIWLVLENGENKETWIEECIYEISPKFFICDLTNKDDNTEARYTSPIMDILYPILELFDSKLRCHEYVSIDESKFRIDRTVHPYWLNNNEGVTFDSLSAIEIKMNNLNLNK